MALLNPLSNAFGLDIGDRTFKLVQVRRLHSQKNPYRIAAWNTIDVPEEVMDRGEIKDMDQAVEYLEKLIKTSKGKLRGRAVVACLPEAKTFIKFIEIPASSTESDLRAAVLKEIEENIPLPQDEIYYDWQVLEEAAPPAPAPVVKEPVPKKDTGKGADDKPAAETAEKPAEAAEPAPQRKSTLKILIGAAPKKLVDTYTSMLESAGLAPVAIEVEATAISRAIVPSAELVDDAVGILDIGATRSSLVIYDSGTLHMSISIPVSGLAVTKLVSERLGVSMADAELLKRECGLDVDRCEDKMWKILLPLIDDMTEKIKNALRFYKIGFPQGKKIERLYLCGGGAQFREIDTVLSRKLTIQVHRGDALANLNRKRPKTFPANEEALTYATAIGLSMRAADEHDKYKHSFSVMQRAGLTLLSPEKKAAMRTGLIFAYVQTMLFIICLIVTFASGTLLAVRLMLKGTYEDLASRSSGAADGTTVITNDIKKINDYLDRIDGLEYRFVPYSKVLEQLAQYVPEGIHLTSVHIDRAGRINISGIAGVRQDVLTLQSRLEQSPIFTGVTAPLSNILEQENVNFTFEMKYKLAPVEKAAPAPKKR